MRSFPAGSSTRRRATSSSRLRGSICMDLSRIARSSMASGAFCRLKAFSIAATSNHRGNDSADMLFTLSCISQKCLLESFLLCTLAVDDLIVQYFTLYCQERTSKYFAHAPAATAPELRAMARTPCKSNIRRHDAAAPVAVQKSLALMRSLPACQRGTRQRGVDSGDNRIFA